MKKANQLTHVQIEDIWQMVEDYGEVTAFDAEDCTTTIKIA